MKGDGAQFSLGFMKPSQYWPFGSARFVRVAGAGGSLGFADPTAGIGYAYVTSQMGTYLHRRPARCGAQRRALRGAPEFRVHHQASGERWYERSCSSEVSSPPSCM